MTTGVYPGKAAFSWQVAALKTCRMDRSRLDALRDGLAARDKYVYVFSADSDSAYVPADRMVLARVSREHIVERDAYEFFTGLDGAGGPRWAEDIELRGAVFAHRGCCLRSGISYNAGLRRYLWWQQLPHGLRSDTRFQAGFGVYDAPEPWGPWTTAYFSLEWDTGPGDTGSFPPKWMSEEGRICHLVFSGNDYFSVRRAVLALRGRA